MTDSIALSPANPTPKFGDTITFNVQTNLKPEDSFLEVICWQGGTAVNFPNGTIVYDESQPVAGNSFTLADTAQSVNHYGWASGGAHAVARLWKTGQHWRTEADLSFEVAP